MDTSPQASSQPGPADPVDLRAATVRRLRLLSGTDDLAFLRVAELLMAKLNVSGVGIFVASADDLLHRVARGPLSGEYPLECSVMRYLLNRQEPLMVSDCMGDSRLAQCQEVAGSPRMRFLAAAPMRAPNDCVIGGLYAFDQKPRFRLRSTLQLLYTLQRQLEDALLIREHERLDLLTRLLQPRAFVSQYLQMWRESLKRGLPIRLAMLRIDGLPALNRLPGRYAGDSVIVQAADLLRERAPRNTVVGRLGGNLYALAFSPSTSNAAVEQFSTQMPWAFKNLVRQSPYPREAALDLRISNVELAARRVPEARPMDLLKAAEVRLLREEQTRPALDIDDIRALLGQQSAEEIAEIERNLSPWPVGGRVV